MRESSLVLYNNEIIDVQLGTGVRVEFDFDKIWEYRSHPEDLRFYHVHPAGFLGYSTTDFNCIKGFNMAFGYPVYFSILTFDELGFMKYNQLSIIYKDGKIEETEHIQLPINYLQVLHTLSYGIKN